MASIIRMPEVLAGAKEAVLANWLVLEGQEIAVGDVLAEIETEKATVEYQAEESGTLAKVLVNPGDLAEVGTPIAIFTSPGEGDADVERALADAGGLPSPTKGATPAPVTLDLPVEPAGPVPSAGRLFMSPLVRKLARENNLDVSALRGSGPAGRIVRVDIEELLNSPAQVSPPAGEQRVASSLATPAQYEEIPHTGMRKAIARRLTESKSTVPHFYLTAHCRVDRLISLRKEANEAKGLKISLNDWVVKAVAQALMDVPAANVVWGESAMKKFSSADISVAVATEGGLYTPVLRAVERLSLPEISATIADLAARARAGKIRQDEIEGGSFAVTNLGMYGTQEFSAILNPPQSGILAVGAASQRPIVVNGELTVASVMTVTLSADHRAIDGALAAEWLGAFQRVVENPVGLLLS